ncbi:MAG: iron-only hydrogenase system regulator [Treponema sp.]|nr:iron-only hydrogenase system regulator [Treponema sp.]
MNCIAVIGAILEDPKNSQQRFNDLIAAFRGIVKGRMGIPFDAENRAVIAITVEGDLDEINALTGKLGKLPGVSVKTAVSAKENHETKQ